MSLLYVHSVIQGCDSDAKKFLTHMGPDARVAVSGYSDLTVCLNGTQTRGMPPSAFTGTCKIDPDLYICISIYETPARQYPNFIREVVFSAGWSRWRPFFQNHLIRGSIDISYPGIIEIQLFLV